MFRVGGILINSKLTAIAIVAVLIAAAGVVAVTTMSDRNDTYAITIDVNPSIDLVLDGDGNVTDIDADDEIEQAVKKHSTEHTVPSKEFRPR